MRLARREGALARIRLDVQQVAHHAGRFAAFAAPQALCRRTQALAEIADSFPGERYANLRRLLTAHAARRDAAAHGGRRFFLRREVEADRALFQGLAFALLEQQGARSRGASRHLEEMCSNHHAGRSKNGHEVAHLSILTHDEVLKISAKLDQLLAGISSTGRELRSDDTLLPISQEEPGSPATS